MFDAKSECLIKSKNICILLVIYPEIKCIKYSDLRCRRYFMIHDFMAKIVFFCFVQVYLIFTLLKCFRVVCYRKGLCNGTRVCSVTQSLVKFTVGLHEAL